MRITQAHIYLIQIASRRPIIVEISTDAGISGLGEAAIAYGIGATAAAGMIQDFMQEIVLGRDPFAIEAICSEMYDHSFWAKGGGPIVFAGISAIETALWDIKGKALGIPIYEMLGGAYRHEARVYANGWSFRSSTPTEFAHAAERVVKDGYNALKLYPLAMPDLNNPDGMLRHVSLRSLPAEAEKLAIERVRAVRDAVGPDIDIMLDMSAELSTDAIIRLGRAMEAFQPMFFEEPVDPFDVAALKKVSDHVNLPIAVGERVYSRYGFRPILEQHAADILMPDIGNTGGIMEAKKIAAMAETYNMRVSPHTCAGPVSTAAALQLDACISNFLIQEVYPYRPPQHFNLVDQAPEWEIRNSIMPISDRPGLGVELVPERVQPFLWAVCEP
ncbi:MAG: mandelate racemase/muconate lactonizing enzyme family protein [Chloroflexi bacterium]|nr:mandelate racemase/muconate lactonizing enzyme family protein [Chloroflexota bacterium]